MEALTTDEGGGGGGADDGGRRGLFAALNSVTGFDRRLK